MMQSVSGCCVRGRLLFSYPVTFYGPYRIVELRETGVVVHPVDQPQGDPIRVAYNRI